MNAQRIGELINMPNITKNLINGKSLYHYSNDIVWSCRHYASLTKKEEHPYSIYIYNNSCVFMAGSFLEAKLNELTAQVFDNGPGNTDRECGILKIIHDERKSLSLKSKWNLISSTLGGQIWDSSKDPFQSFDLIISLRNELVHYKPEYEEVSKPSVKKINDLVACFKSKGFVSIIEPEKEYWVTTLLSSAELSSWISSIVCEFDMKFDFFLTGKEFTKMDETIYKVTQASANPWVSKI